MKFTPNLVIGIVITLVGSVLVLDRLGLLEFQRALQLWPVLVMLFGISVIIQALRPPSEGADSQWQRPIVGPGLVLFLVVISVFGWRTQARRAADGEPKGTDQTMSLVGIMGEDARLVSAPDFGRANMLSVMGSTRLDLRKAGLTPGREAIVDIVGVMGGVEIRVPREWVVDVKAVAIMGGVNDQRPARGPDAPPLPTDAPKLVITGVVVMGGLVIKS